MIFRTALKYLELLKLSFKTQTYMDKSLFLKSLLSFDSVNNLFFFNFSMRFFLSALMMVVMMVVYTTADPATFLVETEDNHGPADVGMYNGLA